MNARLPQVLSWAPADHVAGQRPSPKKDPFPDARLSEARTHLLEQDGTPFFEFTPAEGETVVNLSEQVAKQIAAAVLNQVSAW